MKMKKVTVLTALLVAFCLVVSLPALAVELTPEAARALSDPVGYATVKDGTVVFGDDAAAYSPESLNNLLNAYGATLSVEAANALEGPVGYAKVKDGAIAFGDDATAYGPDIMHKILTAYGLCLTPEAVRSGNVPGTYASVKDGNIVFDKKATAYSPETFNGILNAYDFCEKKMEMAEAKPGDSDGDGVPDDRDRCPNTPRGVKVDAMGCPLDSDGDGVPDYMDQCPNTPRGVQVDAQGCPLEEGEAPATRMDSDGDGVYDDMDECPGTPKGAVVNQVGCWVVGNLLFDYDKSNIKPQYYSDLDQVIRVLKQNPGLRVEIQGHTDNIGSKNYNLPLSRRRAKSVANYLIRNGVDRNRLTTEGYWFSRPVAPNTTPEGRAKNRRVELHPIY